MRQEFTALDSLGFKVENGLCFSMEEAKNNAERLYMDDAKKLGADAVFFRRFYRSEGDDNPYHSEPAVCIFHKSGDFWNSQAHKDLHAALWSSGKTEIYVIQTKNRIDFINARRPAKKLHNDEVTIDDASLKLGRAALEKFNDKKFRKFSAHLFGSGTFWEQKEDNINDKLNLDESPSYFLLNYLRGVRKRLVSSSEVNLPIFTINKLLVLSILVKFLEDKKYNDKHTLEDIYAKFEIESFSEGIRKNLIIDLFEDLQTEFNGKIFDQFNDIEKKQIKNTNLNLISRFLEADIELDTNQKFLWKQYSFQHLPTEVISVIYERFILEDDSENDEGVVYTPIHLVNLLVDEVMPLKDATLFKDEKFRILDPSCGSGVFLVAAYKRLLQWWALNNVKDGIIQFPNREKSQQILEDNIFGVDIDRTAVLISIFSLTTAFLDKLTPKEVWQNLKFKNLSEKNIQRTHFAELATILNEKKEKKQFHLIIGNPPFKAEEGDISKEKTEELFERKIPRNKLALKFLEAGIKFGDRVCMIIPSNNFLYNNQNTYIKYRKGTFTDSTVHKIFDFTHLRRKLFKSADTPVVALNLETKPSEYKSIEHIVVKNEMHSEKNIRFEIDYYDRHQVRWDWATNEKMQFVWKTNLLGGGRLFHLIYRLSLLRRLGDFINANKRNWKSLRGYEGGKGKLLKDKIRVEDIKDNGSLVIEENVTIETSYLKDEFLYQPPFILIKQVIGNESLRVGLVNASNNTSSLYFNRDFVGISTIKREKHTLQNIYDLLSNNLGDNFVNYQLFILATSSSSLVTTETDLNRSEILAVPFSETKEYLKLTEAEKIIQYDVLKYYRHLGKSINEEKTGGKLLKETKEPALKDFGNIFSETLNEIYATKDQSWQIGKIIQTPLFTKYQFGFGEKNGLKYSFSKESEEEIATLLNDELSNQGAVHKRIIRYYKHENGFDCVYLIKPNAKRYWLKSIALRDADDTFIDFKKDGF